MARPDASLDVAVAEGASFEGLVVLPRGARIEGAVTGRIQANGEVWVGPTGRIETDIVAPSVVVEGSVQGHIRASGRLRLGPSAEVLGDVEAGALEIAEGARVNGRCRCGRPVNSLETPDAAPESGVAAS